MIGKELTGALAWVSAIAVLAIGTVIACKLGVIDKTTAMRAMIGVNGLMIAWFGNRIPKAVVRDAQARRATRVAGWSQVLSGLVYTGFWALAPIRVAIWGGTSAILAGFLVTLVFCLLLRNDAKTA
jgi:hypothetical protein